MLNYPLLDMFYYFPKCLFKPSVLLQVNSNEYLEVLLGSFFLFFILLLIGFIVMYIFFLLTLRNTFKLIQPANRGMQPGEVFLLLIPLFNYVWLFIIVNKLSSSLEKELGSRGMETVPKPTFGIGLAYAILSLSIPLFTYIFPVAEYVIIAMITVVICFIIYWSSVAGYKRKLESFGHLVNNYNQNPSINYNSQAINQTNQGYAGGYAGGHNNHGAGSVLNSPTQNYPNQYPNNSGEYKSGDLYK